MTVEGVSKLAQRLQPAAAEHQAAAGTVENKTFEDGHEGAADHAVLTDCRGRCDI